jgi:hypothetical protein
MVVFAQWDACELHRANSDRRSVFMLLRLLHQRPFSRKCARASFSYDLLNLQLKGIFSRLPLPAA